MKNNNAMVFAARVVALFPKKKLLSAKNCIDKPRKMPYNKVAGVTLRLKPKGWFNMPRDFLFTKDEIVKAALDLTREKGFAAVSTRALGEKLGTSSRPVFSHFQNMAEVQKAIVAAANDVYQSYIRNETTRGKYPQYKATGMAYIRFAREERELFKLLFMRDRSHEKVKENPTEMDELVALIGKQVGLDKASAKLFYLEMWAYTHGIATMVATGYLDWDEALTSRALTDVYQSLKDRFQSGQCDNKQ